MSDVLDCPDDETLVRVEYECSLCSHEWTEVIKEAALGRVPCPQCSGIAVPSNIWAPGRDGDPKPVIKCDGRDWRFTVFLLGVGVLIVTYHWLVK